MLFDYSIIPELRPPMIEPKMLINNSQVVLHTCMKPYKTGVQLEVL